jgi:hypothetical protein
MAVGRRSSGKKEEGIEEEEEEKWRKARRGRGGPYIGGWVCGARSRMRLAHGWDREGCVRGWVGVVWSIGGMRAFAFGVEGKDQGDGRSVAAACDAMRACVAFRLSLDGSRGRVPPARYTHRQPECVVSMIGMDRQESRGWTTRVIGDNVCVDFHVD